mgnify:CR=1 FL=1
MMISTKGRYALRVMIDIAIFGQDRLHTLDMHQSVFHAWTVTQIDGKLKHGEAITHDMLSEKGSVLALLDGLLPALLLLQPAVAADERGSGGTQL